MYFRSDHSPLRLDCGLRTHLLAIPLWRLRPETLRDPEYKVDMLQTLQGFFNTNWDTAHSGGKEWGTLKIVIRGESLSKTYGIQQKLDGELTGGSTCPIAETGG
ncbi:hypothetical protein NDU88_004528 [Pleurodeles waltl]|uniref:Uncharacterized protein n=1 Tax=Pleurodeles waltl TaxID=8319 RepID=A0AAV7VHD4_PLEWA|nr:hypothetical protein NDU88_004528 [Pleurodeles waltl]